MNGFKTLTEIRKDYLNKLGEEKEIKICDKCNFEYDGKGRYTCSECGYSYTVISATDMFFVYK
jgi:tRNA(Ile2) C34 agmatinyltransferase TiaS